MYAMYAMYALFDVVGETLSVMLLARGAALLAVAEAAVEDADKAGEGSERPVGVTGGASLVVVAAGAGWR